MTSTCRATRPDGQQCGAKTDGLICTLHLNQVRDALDRIPELLTELDVTISRQDVGTAAPLYAMNRARVQVPGVHYDEGDTTLPSTQWAFSWDAANVRWTIENTLSTWARHIAESRELPTPDDACAFLLDHLDHIRADEAAPEIWDEIRACERDARRAIDRQEPDLFAGRCDAMIATLADVYGDGTELLPELAECGTDLMARTGDDDVKCPTCGAVYDLVEQQAKLDAAIPDALATPTVVANGLSTEDRQVNASTIRTWIERDRKLMSEQREGPVCVECVHSSCKGLRAAELAWFVKLHQRPLIPPRGWDKDGVALCRAGDVQARLAWSEQRKALRRSA